MATRKAKMSTAQLGTKVSKVNIEAVVNPQLGMLGIKPRPGPKVPELRKPPRSR